LGTVGEAEARKGNEETPAISSNREGATLGGSQTKSNQEETLTAQFFGGIRDDWLARVRIGRCMARIGERARVSELIDAKDADC
jgi:hypothetical protein